VKGKSSCIALQKLGAQGKQTRKRQPVVLPEQQLSLFGMLVASD
jgi:hypothetical protein